MLRTVLINGADLSVNCMRLRRAQQLLFRATVIATLSWLLFFRRKTTEAYDERTPDVATISQ